MTATATTTMPMPTTESGGDAPDVAAPRRPRAVGLHLALIVGLVVMIAPFVWMILSSFKLTPELRRYPTSWIPKEPTVENYRDLFDPTRFPALLPQLDDRRSRRHRRQPAVLLDARLRLGKA